MLSLKEVRKKLPHLAAVDDYTAVKIIQGAYYPDVPVEQLAAEFGLAPPAVKEKPMGGMHRLLNDVGVTAAKAAVGVPETVIGIADLVTGGRAGKFAEGIGVRTKEANEMLDEAYSPQTKEAYRKVADAPGFIGKAITAIENPSTILTTTATSLPSMALGGGIGAAVGKIPVLATKVVPWVGKTLGLADDAVLGAIGEGLVSAGQTAEQARQEKVDKSDTLTPQDVAVAGGSGALTALITIMGGRVANRLGIGEVDSAIVRAMRSGDQAQVAAAQQVQRALTNKGVTRKIIEGAFTEGVMEELPQSVQEQIAQNLISGKPLEEGVELAAVMGMLAGGLMGGAIAPFHGAPAGAAPGAVQPDRKSVV